MSNNNNIMVDNEEQNKILEILNELFENADGDCPQENRTRHFRTVMSDAEEILINYHIRIKNT